MVRFAAGAGVSASMVMIARGDCVWIPVACRVGAHLFCQGVFSCSLGTDQRNLEWICGSISDRFQVDLFDIIPHRRYVF